MKTARRWVRWIARHNKEQINYYLMFLRMCWSEKDRHIKTSTVNRELGRDISVFKRKRAFNQIKADSQLFRTNQGKSESCFTIPSRREPGIGHKKMSVNNNYSDIFIFFSLRIWLKPQVYICSFTPETLSHLPSHSTSRLSQNTGLSSLFYTANSHELSILHMVIRFHARLSSHPTHSFPHCVCPAALQTSSSFSIVNVSGLFMYPINMDLHEFNPLDRAIFKKAGFPGGSGVTNRT